MTTGIDRKAERADLIAVLVMLALFLGATWMSWGFSPRARLAPLFISASCVVFLLLDLVQRLFRRKDVSAPDALVPAERPRDGLAEGTIAAVTPKPAVKPQLHSSVNALFTMLLPFVALVFLIGLLPAALVFIFVYIRLVAKSSFLSAGLYALATFLVLRTLFVGLLGVFMYRGVFGLYLPFISG